MHVNYCKFFPIEEQVDQTTVLRQCISEQAMLIKEGLEVSLKKHIVKTEVDRKPFFSLEARLSPKLQPFTVSLLETRGFRQNESNSNMH